MFFACLFVLSDFFDLKAITTSNLLTIIQIVVVIGGFYFSLRSLKATRESIKVASDSLQIAAKSLDLSTKNAQAQLFNQLVLQARDLQFKFSETFYDASTEQGRKQRRDSFIGTLIGYYSACFELRNVLPLPPTVEKLLAVELKELICKDEVRAKWESVRHLHSAAFGEYVTKLREGVK